MKKLIAAVLVAAPLMATAGEINGTWQTATSDEGAYLHVAIAPCANDAALVCGIIVGQFNGTGDDITGKTMIWDMQARGEDNWRRGKIWAPDDDKTYRANMTLNGNNLEVEGCVAVFCRGQTWTRVN